MQAFEGSLQLKPESRSLAPPISLVMPHVQTAWKVELCLVTPTPVPLTCDGPRLHQDRPRLEGRAGQEGGDIGRETAGDPLFPSWGWVLPGGHQPPPHRLPFLLRPVSPSFFCLCAPPPPALCLSQWVKPGSCPQCPGYSDHGGPSGGSLCAVFAALPCSGPPAWGLLLTALPAGSGVGRLGPCPLPPSPPLPQLVVGSAQA